MVPSLDDLDEEGGSVLKRLREDLEQVALLVEVHEDLEVLDDREILLDLGAMVSESFSQVDVVLVGDGEELEATSLHRLDGVNDVLGSQGSVLDTVASVVLNVLLDLGLSLAGSGLVDGELHVLVEVGNNDGSQSRVLSVHHLVVDGPEAVEVKHLFIPRSDGLHVAVGLVTNAMVDDLELGDGDDLGEGLGHVVSLEAGEEDSLVVHSLDEAVDGVSESLDLGDDNTTIIVLVSGGLLDGGGSSLDGLLENASGIINGESNILDSVSVLVVVGGEILVSSRVQRGSEGKDDSSLSHNVGGEFSVSSLESLVGEVLEAESGAVEGSGLLGVANPEPNVVESMEDSDFGSLGGFFVVHDAKRRYKLIIA
mmetsp:Transcript_19254/g.29532  ORF Transcript_19254/g.29532 Transcript_19254/m.29532 type:complete len:368 (+) Transcript_19254:150-1253(+)